MRRRGERSACSRWRALVAPDSRHPGCGAPSAQYSTSCAASVLRPDAAGGKERGGGYQERAVWRGLEQMGSSRLRVPF